MLCRGSQTNRDSIYPADIFRALFTYKGFGQGKRAVFSSVQTLHTSRADQCEPEESCNSAEQSAVALEFRPSAVERETLPVDLHSLFYVGTREELRYYSNGMITECRLAFPPEGGQMPCGSGGSLLSPPATGFWGTGLVFCPQKEVRRAKAPQLNS